MEFLKELLKYAEYAPKFFAELFGVITGPKSFFRELDTHDVSVLHRAVFFVIGSNIFIAASYPFIAASKYPFLQYLIEQAAVYMLCTMLCTLAVWAGWRSVGAKINIVPMLTISFYLAGASLFLQEIIVILFASMMTAYDPDFYEDVIRASLKWQAGTFWKTRPPESIRSEAVVYLSAAAILCGGLILIGIWYFAAWGAYREVAHKSHTKSAAALLVSVVLLLPCLASAIFIGAAISQHMWRAEDINAPSRAKHHLFGLSGQDAVLETTE